MKNLEQIHGLTKDQIDLVNQVQSCRYFGKLKDILIERELGATLRWLKACFNKPQLLEIKMAAYDEIIGGFGCVSIFSENNEYMPKYEYVNMGDTYMPTIIHSYVSGKTFVGCYGDLPLGDCR